MQKKKPVSQVLIYIYLAVSCAVVGVVLTFALLFTCRYFDIDVLENWWLLGIPVVLAVLLNITTIELFQHFRK